MSTTARLEDLKRDLARLERKWTGPRHDSLGAEGDRGREAGHPIEEITKIITEALKDYPDLSKEEPPRVLLTTSTAASMSVTVLVYVENISQMQTIKSEVLRLLITKLAEHQIKIV